MCLICSAARIKGFTLSDLFFKSFAFGLFHVIFDVLLVGFFCEGVFLQVMSHCAFGTFAFGAVIRGISTDEQVTNVTLCPTDHLPLHLQAQPFHDLQDLVDVRDHLITADEVLVDDHDYGWRETAVALAWQELGALSESGTAP